MTDTNIGDAAGPSETPASPVTPQQPVKPQQIATRGWASFSARLVTALLLVESVTGLWLYLAPFSASSQLQLLVHVSAGLLVTLPWLYFQWRHLKAWWKQRLTVVAMIGYLLMALIATCVVSGLVLTWQSAAGPRISPVWDIVHLVSGIGTSVLVVVHLTLAFVRRRIAARSDPKLARARTGFVRATLAGLALYALGTLGLSAAWPSAAFEMELPEDYVLPDYLQEYDEYQGSPFAPTYARTESGKLVDPAVLSGSESCGTSGCHEQILAEWQPSAHRFSAANPPFLQVQANFAADRSPAETRYCAGCHDPISLFAGAKDIHNMDLAAPGMQEGISCIVCHSMSKVDQRGNADYVLTPPKKYLWEGTKGWRKFVSDFLVRAYPRQHLADYDRNLLRSPEFCASCHKQFIPEALNRFGLSPGQNQYDEWRMSHWHSEDPEIDLSCRDCHMRLVSSTDPGHGEGGDVRRSSDDGMHRHHGTIATNMFMPAVMKLPHWEEQVRMTEEWIRGETRIPEIAHLWPDGPVATLDLQGPEVAQPGEEVSLRVVTSNRKAGHNFITGPLDFVRAWVHLRVLDARGETLAEWGRIDPETRRIMDSEGTEHEIGNSRKEGTLVLESMPLDSEGNPLKRHELWKKAGGEGHRVIFAGHADHQQFSFVVPPKVQGPLRIVADLNFRRYRQEFLDLVLPDMEKDSGVLQPTVTQSSAELILPVGPPRDPAEESAPEPKDERP